MARKLPGPRLPSASRSVLQPSLTHHQHHSHHLRPQLRRVRPFPPIPPQLLMLAAVLTLAGLAQQAAAAADSWDRSRCPAWLPQYETWHRANRGLAGARYLIADAPGFVGVGDHLRGFMYALRVAAATNRVLLLRWEHPGNLTDFLVPGSGIDWRWDGTPAPGLLPTDRGLKVSDGQKLVMQNNDIGKAFPDANFFSSDPAGNKTFLVLKSNQPAEQKCVLCPGVVGKPSDSYDFVCMFRYLFKASPQVQHKTDEVLRSLYPQYSNSSSGNSTNASSSDSFAYQAVHLRLGMMRGEESVINRISGYVDPLAKFLLAVSCGSGLAAERGLDTAATPLLLLADHRGVRQFSRHSRLANVVTPAYEAVHTKMNSVESHLLSFVDLNLMARAKCVVLSHSGFSNVGWWLSGGNSCRMMLAECHKACAKFGQGGQYCP